MDLIVDLDLLVDQALVDGEDLQYEAVPRNLDRAGSIGNMQCGVNVQVVGMCCAVL